MTNKYRITVEWYTEVEGISVFHEKVYRYYGLDQYQKALETFEKLVAMNKYSTIYLQEYVLCHNRGYWGDLHSYSKFEEEYEEYDKSSGWRPGDAPWNAPGMSVSDFI